MECTYAADVLGRLREWVHAERSVAVATIVHIRGSSSRPLGTRMICTDREEFFGAVSGGCVETDVCRIAREVLHDGASRIIHYGPVKEPELQVGLNCDGEIDVLVEPVDNRWLETAETPFTGVVILECSTVSSATAAARPVNVKRSRHTEDSLHSDAASSADARRLALDAWHRGTAHSSRDDRTIRLAEPVLPPPILVAFGAGPVADALARMARIMGYTTVLSDPRESRFPAGITETTDTTDTTEPASTTTTAAAATPAATIPSPVVPGPAANEPAHHAWVSWPDRTIDRLVETGMIRHRKRTYIVSLEHEPRFEDALWHALLRVIDQEEMRRPAYIGAIGKAQRAMEREERARARGVDLAPLQPIHTPIGLDIGGKTAEEIAVSIIAEIVATVHERPGGRPGTLRSAEIRRRT